MKRKSNHRFRQTIVSIAAEAHVMPAGKIDRISKILVSLAIAFLIYTALGLVKIAFFDNDYDIRFVDSLVDSILENPDESKMEQLLAYKTRHSVDASFSLHYHACLWVIYKKYPKLLLKYRNGHYRNTIEKVIERGEGYFQDFYPNGRL